MGAADDAADAEAKATLICRNASCAPLQLQVSVAANGRSSDPGDSGALEAGAIRKLNRHVLTILFAVAMLCYIDRTNLAFASVSGCGSGFGYPIFKRVTGVPCRAAAAQPGPTLSQTRLLAGITPVLLRLARVRVAAGSLQRRQRARRLDPVQPPVTPPHRLPCALWLDMMWSWSSLRSI
jgi:hypothetical protein